MDDEDKSALTDRIAELESLLIAQREASDQPRQADIPILDELITDAEEDLYPELPFGDEEPAPPRLEQIADELEQKLSHELDEIVALLKTNMRESIMNELQSLLHNDPAQKTDS